MGLAVRIVKRVKGFTLDAEWQIGTELAVLFGSSGSGKSMTLQCIAGLMNPDEGLIRANGDLFFDHARKVNILPQNRSFGYVFQDRALFPHMTVRGNITYGCRGLSKAEARGAVDEMIELFHLRGLEDRYPSDISGGQKQRVALARALIGKPEALLLDEPFSGLDQAIRFEMRKLLEEIRVKFDIPVVLVTHDIVEAYSMADRIIVYSSGRVSRTGPPHEIFRSSGRTSLDEIAAVLNGFA
jgi:molybdate transport system ATP-binding protein